MKKYTKLITLSSVLLVLIALIVLAMVFDVDLFLFKNLSISGIHQKKNSVEALTNKEIIEMQSNLTSKSELKEEMNSYDVAKQAYENIDESTIEIVQEATKEEKYFIEYLWVVLGNYANINKVDINIETPGSVTVVEETATSGNQNTQVAKQEVTQKEESQTQQTTQENMTRKESVTSKTTSTAKSNEITITVEGRYANVADFVFDVENDKSLRFKLDNIKMSYSGNNKIKATFKVLSLDVLK